MTPTDPVAGAQLLLILLLGFTTMIVAAAILEFFDQ